MAQTNQQILVSDEVTIDDRLDSLVDDILGEGSDEPIPEQEDNEDDVEQDEGDTEPDEDTSEDPEPEYVEIRHNGKPVKMTLDEVLEHASKGFDYTVKTQELAETRRQIDAQAQLLQQNYQLQQVTLQQTAALYSMDSQLKNYENVNWDGWMDQDPIEASKGWQKFQMLKSSRDDVANSITQTQNQAQYQTQQQLSRQLAEGANTLAREIKNWSPELAKSLKQNALDYGFSDTELDQVYDPRMVKVLHDAYQWRQLQSKKPEVQKRVTQAPKSAKPSGKIDNPEANRKNLLKQLKTAKGTTTRASIANSLLDKFV